MRITSVVPFLTFLLCAHVIAGDLSVTGQPGLVWNPLAEPSPVHIFGIENTTGTTDTLLAWELSLRLTGAPGSTGTVRFNTASLPPDYLLEGRSSGLSPPFSGPSEEIQRISDFDADFAGVSIPDSGKNLLQVDFVASEDALGLFKIELLPFDADRSSYWFSVDGFAETEFLNAPAAGGPSVIGGILIVVPEPPSTVPAWVGVALLFGLRRHQMHRGRGRVGLV